MKLVIDLDEKQNMKIKIVPKFLTAKLDKFRAITS